MPKRPEDSLAEMVANLKNKTGHTLEEWSTLIKAKSLARHGEIMALLKDEHGVSHGYANQIALNHLKSANSAKTSEDPVEDLYSGTKAALRPIHDKVMEKVQSFGSDVDVAPKKAYLSLRRSKQFAIVQPSTATRLDIGINLKGVEPTSRLERSGSFNAMLSHRVRVGSVDEVDDELVGWLRQAYNSA